MNAQRLVTLALLVLLVTCAGGGLWLYRAGYLPPLHLGVVTITATLPPALPSATVEPSATLEKRSSATVTMAPTPTPTPTRLHDRGNCDPAYPSVCIASLPEVVRCDTIPFKWFVVLAPDPHNLDRDRNGLGCDEP